MKTLLVAISMLVIGSVHAGEVKIFDKSIYEIGYAPSITPNFVLNEELGRAWVEVTVSNSDPEAESDVYRVKVPELSFDKTDSAVVIQHEGQLVTCANIVTTGRSIFRQRVIKMSDRCKFKGQWRKITYDDGFEIKQTEKYSIVLVIE